MGTAALKTHLAIWLATIAPAAAVHASPELAHDVRTALAFRLEPRPGTLNEALGILATNARATAALLLTAIAVTGLPPLRPILDAFVTTIVVANAALVGIATGAYGAAAMPWLIHLPLEWTALGTATAAYAAARAGPTSPRALARAAALTTLLLIAAAATETYLTPQA